MKMTLDLEGVKMDSMPMAMGDVTIQLSNGQTITGHIVQAHVELTPEPVEYTQTDPGSVEAWVLPNAVNGDDTLQIMAESIPGFSHMVATHPLSEKGPYPLSEIIINLNDQHRWTREQIAEWLDTLDLDLRIRPEEAKAQLAKEKEANEKVAASMLEGLDVPMEIVLPTIKASKGPIEFHPSEEFSESVKKTAETMFEAGQKFSSATKGAAKKWGELYKKFEFDATFLTPLDPELYKTITGEDPPENYFKQGNYAQHEENEEGEKE